MAQESAATSAEEVGPRGAPRFPGSGAQALGEVLARARIGADPCARTDFSVDPFVWALEQASVLERAAMAMAERACDALVELMAQIAAAALEADPGSRDLHRSRYQDLQRRFAEVYKPSMEAWIYMPQLWSSARSRLQGDREAARLPSDCPFQLSDLVGSPVDVDRLTRLLVVEPQPGGCG